MTHVDRDTISMKVEGQKWRYLNQRAQTRMYGMNLLMEANNSIDAYTYHSDKEMDIKSFKAIKSG
ncbi:MAG: hypothetical protein GXP45_02985 [bacterium]|nr:hypothetical protein [bacterium]